MKTLSLEIPVQLDRRLVHEVAPRHMPNIVRKIAWFIYAVPPTVSPSILRLG
jgi:hypothetical protein